MAQIKLSTTGTLAHVIINDLAASEFVHPVTDLILFDTDYPQNYPYTIGDVNSSIDLQYAVTAGYITLSDQNDNIVTDIQQEISIIVSSETPELQVIVGTSSTVTLDQFDMGVSNGCIWNILAANGTDNKLLGSINALHNLVGVDDSNLYGMLTYGTALLDLRITTAIDNGYYKLMCQNLSSSRAYVVKIKQNYFKV